MQACLQVRADSALSIEISLAMAAFTSVERVRSKVRHDRAFIRYQSGVSLYPLR
jgi:hypothetical protein